MREPSNPVRLLGFAALAWTCVFLLIPFLMVVAISFMTKGTYTLFTWTPTLESYTRIADPIYIRILSRSAGLALATTAVCLALGFPMAWAMATASPRARRFFILALAVPFLTNLIIRIYSLKVVVGFDGPLAWLLAHLGIAVDPFSLSQNLSLVIYGMVSTYLPFMVFPLYASFEKFDFNLLEAARDLGAGDATIAFRVLLPLLRPAMATGSALVFIPALGEYVIPDLLGGARTMLIGNLITEQFLKSRDWPFGSALAVSLAIVVFLPMLVARYVQRQVPR